MKDHPIGGDKTDDIECPHCGDTDTVYEEYGTSESDYSGLTIACNTCDGDEDDIATERSTLKASQKWEEEGRIIN